VVLLGSAGAGAGLLELLVLVLVAGGWWLVALALVAGG
jgi:hypothetical protein